MRGCPGPACLNVLTPKFINGDPGDPAWGARPGIQTRIKGVALDRKLSASQLSWWRMFGGDIYVINASFDTKITVYVHREEVMVILAPRKRGRQLFEHKKKNRSMLQLCGETRFVFLMLIHNSSSRLQEVLFYPLLHRGAHAFALSASLTHRTLVADSGTNHSNGKKSVFKSTSGSVAKKKWQCFLCLRVPVPTFFPPHPPQNKKENTRPCSLWWMTDSGILPEPH